MTAVINKLKDKTGNQQLPVTHERAVRDSEGTTLETKLQNLEGAMDKAYVASSDNGMGRITLHKNMVSGVNTLTQSMMQATNTIYVIRYDFTLGEDITVPANCVLEFEGGSITSNYKLTLSAGSKVIKGKISLGESGNIIIGGDSVTIECCVINKDRENDGSQYTASYQAIFANGKKNLYLKDNSIYLTGLGSFTTLISCTNVEILNNRVKNTIFNPAEDSERTCGVELIDSCQYVKISGNTIANTNLPISAFTNSQKVTDVQIIGNTIINSMAYGICIYDVANDGSRPVENVVISGNIIKNVYGGDSYGAGIYLLESANIVVSDNYIENTAVNTTVSGTLAPAGIGLNNSNNITVSDNIIKTSKFFGIVVHGESDVVSGNNIKDCPISIEIRHLFDSRIVNNITDKGFNIPSSLINVSITENTCSNIVYTYTGTGGHNVLISKNNINGPDNYDGFLLYINDNNSDFIIDGNVFDGDCGAAIWGSPTDSCYTNNVFLCNPINTNMQFNIFGSGSMASDNYIKNIKVNDLSPMNYEKSGASSERPAHPTFGMMYKDNTLNKPIWFDGSNWVDATGNPV